MYTYIVERTQIYLTARESAALDAAARRTGHTRSHLIREAIEAAYLRDTDIDERLAVIEATAGSWRDRTESTDEIMARLRTGRIARLRVEEAEAPDEATD
jgi:predicted DNA-binding protein